MIDYLQDFDIKGARVSSVKYSTVSCVNSNAFTDMRMKCYKPGSDIQKITIRLNIFVRIEYE